MSTPDPRFPDYQCGSYRSQLGRWRYLDAVYRGRDAWVDCSPNGRIQPNDLTRFYLPQAPQERAENYHARFAGLVFSNEVRFVDVLYAIRDCLGNADIFLMGRAISSMRRGRSLVLVDTPLAY